MATVKSPQPPLKASTVMAKKTEWNTKQLGPRLGADFASAFCAATLVAPLITLIDRSIIQRTHEPAPLLSIFTTNLRNALRRPITFFTSAPFLLITTLYTATFTTANFTDTASSTVRNKPAGSVTAGPAKFLAVSSVNLTGSMYKDAQFAKMFGAGAAGAARTAARVAKPVPTASLALFAVRDSMTMFASFNVPAILGPMIGSLAAAQFLAPAGVQFLSTPLHLFGLDLYNRPRSENNLKLGDRMQVVRRDWIQASLGRVCRIVPAYGLGGVMNTGIRKRLMGALE